MRIAMISYHTCPLATLGGKDTGGMNVYVRDLSRELGRRGIGVDVFTRSQDEHQPHVKHDLGHGNRVVHVPAGDERPLPRSVLHALLPEFRAGIQEFTESVGTRYDLIHSHYWLSGLAAQALGRAWGVPFVHMFHTLGAMKNRVAQAPSEMESPLRLSAEVELLTAAHRIIVPTPAERAQLQWLAPVDVERLVVIPPGVDLSLFRRLDSAAARTRVGVPEGDRMLLFVGRIEPLKGIDTLLRALALLREHSPTQVQRLCLSIIGGDEDGGVAEERVELERLKALCDELGLGSLVTFLGRRDQDTLPDYYAAAEAVVMPSHYESFGMVALEAMACGTPVVASEVGGLAYLVRDGVTGFHVPERDPGALAQALHVLLANPELRAELGENAAEYARGYAWTIMADRIVAVYRSVLEPKRLAPMVSPVVPRN